MLKKILGLTMMLSLVMATNALADKGPGCGLGATLFKGKKGLVPHVLAATTNGTSYNQLFGITSGTLGCSEDAVVKKEKEQEVFVASNLQPLSQEMARGSGAHLDSLATLMGCTGAAHTDFARMTQEKFTSLFPDDATGTMDLLDGLKREIKADPRLASTCTRVS